MARTTAAFPARLGRQGRFTQPVGRRRLMAVATVFIQAVFQLLNLTLQAIHKYQQLFNQFVAPFYAIR